MRPQHLKIHLAPEQSFSVRHDVVPHFYNKLHYHSEIELVFIIKGTGRLFVVDAVHYFKSGDIILLGENLPHLWRSDDKYLFKKAKSKCEAYVIHFTHESFGKEFFCLPENKILLSLLKRAKQAIRIKDNTKLEVINLMQTMSNALSTKRIIYLLKILDVISTSKHIKTIRRQSSDFNFSSSDSERINTVYEFIMQNFSRKLSLKEVAAVAHLSQNSFCRYFKSRIKKSLSKFLIEIRIANACKLLAETEKPIADICYECGYNNFSNFNKHFRTITHRTPLQHRKYYTEAVCNRTIKNAPSKRKYSIHNNDGRRKSANIFC